VPSSTTDVPRSTRQLIGTDSLSMTNLYSKLQGGQNWWNSKVELNKAMGIDNTGRRGLFLPLAALTRSLTSLISTLIARLVFSNSFSWPWRFSLKYGLSVRHSVNSKGRSPIMRLVGFQRLKATKIISTGQVDDNNKNLKGHLLPQLVTDFSKHGQKLHVNNNRIHSVTSKTEFRHSCWSRKNELL